MRLDCRTFASIGLCVAALVGSGCGSPGDPTGRESRKLEVSYDAHGEPAGLGQYNPYCDQVTSGAQPEGEVAFRNLAALGYRTIVSVDGAVPDVELARKYGIRYVHVPMQYSGVKPEQIAQIAKAIDVAGGPVYVHCHHGKHRSPAGLGAACVSLGLMTPEAAVEEMHVSGTDAKYQGLFRDVLGAKPISRAELDAMSSDLPQVVKPGDIASAMVFVDQRWAHLKASKRVSWGVPADSPDVSPPHEARMLWEQFREMSRLDDAKSHGEKFVSELTEAETAAKDLEDALRAGNAAAAEHAFNRSANACSSCHKPFRDN